MMRMTIAGIIGSLLIAAPDDKEDLAEAAAKTLTLVNYSFKGRLTVEGVAFLPKPIEYQGSYVKDRGFMAAMGPFGSIFKLEKKVAVKDPDTGTWILLKPRTKVGKGPIAAEIPIVARGLRPPHEELKRFEGRFKEVKKRDGVEKIGDVACAVYEGPLTEGGVRACLPAGVGLALPKGSYEGTGRAWVGDGRVLRFEADAKAKIDDKGETLELSYKRTTELSDIGKATIDMPAEVKKLFEE